MTAGMPIHYRELRVAGQDGASTYVPHSDVDGSGLELSVVELDRADAATTRHVRAERDEVLYVLDGHVDLEVDGEVHALRADGAAHVTGGTAYALRGGPCEVAIVSGRTEAARDGEAPVCLDLADRTRHPAVGDREFQLLFEPASGCSGMTQFVGYVPTVRTARHIHLYSEMLCIVRGHGLVEIDGHEFEVAPGSCYYLPAGTPHLVQNSGEELLVELGVFTPAGSPAQNTPVA